MTVQQLLNLSHSQHYYLSDLIGIKIISNGKKIGKLDDFVVFENGDLAEIRSLYVSRPFGDPSLLIPWDKVISFTKNEIMVSIEDMRLYEKAPGVHDILLKDHILDKKVIDTQDREVEVVYDIRLLYKDNKLYVSDVDLSKSRMLKRLKLKIFANLFQYIAGKMRDQKVSWKYIQHLPPEIGRFKGDVRLNILKEKLNEIHPADLAHILEELDYDERAKILETIDPEHASLALEEIDPSIQRDIAETMPMEKIVQLLSPMTAGQIADILAALPYTEARKILNSLEQEKVKKINALLDKQEENILALSTHRIIKLPPTMKIAEAQKQFQTLAKDKAVVMYLYIVDNENHLLGTLDIKELLEGRKDALLQDVMKDNVITLNLDSTYKEASTMFAKYDFRAIPVVDNNNRLLGALTYKDLMRLKHRFID